MSLWAMLKPVAAQSLITAGEELCLPPCTETILFDRNADRPGTDELPKLLQLARCMKDHPQQPFVLIGHTDERGAAAYNLVLGQRRADAVKFFLATEGIAVERLTTRSRGENDPLDPQHAESAWAGNRRVEVAVPAEQ